MSTNVSLLDALCSLGAGGLELFVQMKAPKIRACRDAPPKSSQRSRTVSVRSAARRCFA